jgi:hypothetical protein
MDPDISNNQQEQTVSGLFNDRNSMERAWDILSARGYTKEEINILMSEQTRNTLFPEDPEAPHVHTHTTTEAERGNKALEGAGAGGALGGALGGIIGVVAAAGTTLLIPGLGLVVAGPIAAGLAGAGAGSISGGIIGSLIGAGISPEKAVVYEEGLKQGKILMSVKVRNQEDAGDIDNVWHTHFADNH